MSCERRCRGVGRGTSQTTAPATKTDPKINEPFKKPDVKEFIKKFESDDREIYAKRNEIVAALGLSPGMAVADVGAGTGLFTRLFAEKVGTTGKVYAVDIAPRFLAHIAAEAKKARTTTGRDGAGEPGLDAICRANRLTWCFCATCIITWRSRRRPWPRSARRSSPAASWW